MESSHAQWINESIPLDAGWNAVSFSTQPEPSDCDLLFSNLPVTAVHKWDRSQGGIEFNDDPSNTVAVAPNWLVWRPAWHPQAFLNDYDMVEAGESYLIEMSNSATLSFAGRAQIVEPEWLVNEFNLVGLPVSSTNPPTFTDFFRHTADIESALPDAEFFRILTNGTEQKIFQPALTDMARNESYWVKAGQVGAYAGPLRVTISDASSLLDYGTQVYPKTLRIENVSTSQVRTAAIAQIGSGSPPTVNGTNLFPVSEGSVPLSYEVTEGFEASYQPLPSLIVTNLQPLSAIELKLLPRVAEMTGGDSNSVWESIIRVTDTSGEVEQNVGVSARGGASIAEDPSGLWVGDVYVTEVSRKLVNPTQTQPASDVYTYRVLFHVDRDENVMLMQRALLAWDPDGQITVSAAGTYTSGVYSLFGNEADAKSFIATNTDARVTRISSVHFPIMDPLALSGAWGPSNQVEGTVRLDYTNRVNPFVHRYAPLHDNLEYNNDVPAPLPEGQESFTVDRLLRFSFLGEDPVYGAGNPYWGISVNGGTFEEEVSGLNDSINSTNKIYVKGTFRIQKVNDVDHIE